jgi:phenylacetate-coenzyme A ligase PaaK-like adenylate-forming protein
MAVQSWNRKGMTFIPNSNFYEFIPEEEWAKSREDIFYEPKTVLLSEVVPGGRYELVITNFYGMPFIRYRLGHLIRITDLEDEEAQIFLPQMVFETRADDLIDIAGFTRICEKSVSQAIAGSGVDCEDWLARKETKEGKPTLHIYMELNRNYPPEDLASALHNELVKVDPGYHDLAMMMEIYPLQVTTLKRGSFNKYAKARHNAGFELAQQRPPRMNASEEDILELMDLMVRKVALDRVIDE